MTMTMKFTLFVDSFTEITLWYPMYVRHDLC